MSAEPQPPAVKLLHVAGWVPAHPNLANPMELNAKAEQYAILG